MAYILTAGTDKRLHDQFVKIGAELSCELLSIPPDKENVTDFLEKYASLMGAVVIGRRYPDPIQLAQLVVSKDKNTSILILRHKQQLSQFKLSLLFTPFVGDNVKIVAYDQPEDIYFILTDIINRTRQRRSFNRMVSSANTFKPDIQTGVKLRMAYLDKFLDNAPVGAILLDQMFRVVALNQRSKELINISEDEAIGSPVLDFFSPKEIEKIKGLLNEASPKIEVALPNNKVVSLKTSVLEYSGKGYRILTLNDVTDRVRAQEELKSKIGELERSNKELEQFAYIVSHDLKNPLSSILLTAKLAGDNDNISELNDYIKRIYRSGEHMMDLIKGLEELIDVQKGVEGNLSIVDLEKISEEVIRDIEIQVKDLSAQVSTDFSKAASIKYITAYIHSIFSNLISNAVKYKKHDVPLELKIWTEKEEGYIILHIKDNGIGINMEYYGNDIFKPFKRFTEQAQGRGIGLSIINNMITRNGGKIEVKSKEGEGTEFLCFLKPY